MGGACRLDGLECGRLAHAGEDDGQPSKANDDKIELAPRVLEVCFSVEEEAIGKVPLAALEPSASAWACTADTVAPGRANGNAAR